MHYSENCQNKLNKTFQIYEKSEQRKNDFKACYDRHLVYFKEGKQFPFSFDDFYMTFRAKNFFKNLVDCGSWLHFRWYIQSDITKLHTSNFCKRDKLCPACAVRRAYKQQLKFMKILETDEVLPNSDWYYIVIPVKHNIKENFETVFAKVERIRRAIVQSLNNGKKGVTDNIWTSFSGGMYSVETTHTSNGWNVHLNLMINAPKGTKIYLKRVKNRKGQISVQNDEIRQFLLNVADSQMHDITFLEDNTKMRDNLVEVLKYSLKFSSLTNQELLEIFIKTRKKRLFGSFGNMYGKDIENVVLEGDEIVDDEFLELIFSRGEFGYSLESEILRNTKTPNVQ